MDRRERIALNLRDLIAEAGYQHQELAEALGIGPASLSKWLRGETELRVEDAYRIAQILELRLSDFLAQIGYTDPAELPVSFDVWAARARERRRLGIRPTPPELPARDVKRPGANRLHSTLRDAAHKGARDTSNRPDASGSGTLTESYGAHSPAYAARRAG